MNLPTAVLRDLLHLSSSVGLEDDALTAPLVTLVAGLQATVPSYRGLHLTLVEDGHPAAWPRSSTPRTSVGVLLPASRG